jgi:hypothetical protein
VKLGHLLAGDPALGLQPQRLGDDGLVPRPALRTALLVGVSVTVAQGGDQGFEFGAHGAPRGWTKLPAGEHHDVGSRWRMYECLPCMTPSAVARPRPRSVTGAPSRPRPGRASISVPACPPG